MGGRASWTAGTQQEVVEHDTLTARIFELEDAVYTHK